MTTIILNTFEIKVVKCGSYFDWVHYPWPHYGDEVNYVSYKKGVNLSIGHPRGRDGKYHQGSSWFMKKHECLLYGQPVRMYRFGEGPAYEGFFRLSDSNDTTYNSGQISDQYEDHEAASLSYSARAFNALKPDLPDFSPMVSLIELRELPQMLKDMFETIQRRIAKHPKGSAMSRAGKHHLAVQFGWLPLLSDISNFVDAFSKRKKRYEQLLRDEGQGVKRSKTLYNSADDEGTPVHADITYGHPWNPYFNPVQVTQCYGGGNATLKSRGFRKTRIWCKGKSRYFLPSGPRDKQWERRLKRRLLGLYLTPSDVYNLIPWSWLVDYFTTLGDHYEAISSGIAELVVFDYAYIMRTDTYELHQRGTQWVCTNPNGSGGWTEVASFRELNEVVKTRYAATPFGFGLKHSDLTIRQIGILGALGASSL